MDEDGYEEALHVLRRYVVPAAEDCPRARGTAQRERPAHGAADRRHLDLAGGADERDDPAADLLVDEDLLQRVPQPGDLLDRRRRPKPPERMPVELLLDDLPLEEEVGIAERGLHEEAIELRLRERRNGI